MARRNDDILDRLLGSFSLRGFLLNPATMFVVATLLVIGAAIFLWESHSDRIVNLEEFRLTEERIQMTPQPEWVDVLSQRSNKQVPKHWSNLKKLVISESTTEGELPPSVLDTQLVSRTAELMRNVGYVERVSKIEKSKSGLNIELVYRTPVALVELSEDTFPYEWPKNKSNKSVFLPVDRLGVVMPESLGFGQTLPKILVVYPVASPNQFGRLKSWSDWPDERIKDAAAISAIVEKANVQFGVARIITRRKPNQVNEQANWYELWPDSGTQVVWGNAPGKEAEGEASAAEKLRVIEDYVRLKGPLNQLSSMRIDVRSGSIVEIHEAKTASLEKLFTK